MAIVFDFADINRRMNRKPQPVATVVDASCSGFVNVGPITLSSAAKYQKMGGWELKDVTDHGHMPTWTMPNSGAPVATALNQSVEDDLVLISPDENGIIRQYRQQRLADGGYCFSCTPPRQNSYPAISDPSHTHANRDAKCTCWMLSDPVNRAF